MDNQAYLIFQLQELWYGIDAELVQEVFPLPELTPLAEAPPDIIGMLNLRGKIVPVMHLACRLGQSQPNCKLKDAVIIMDWQGIQVGIVVNQVQDVLTFGAAAIDTSVEYGRSQASPYIKGVTRELEVPIVFLNPETLIRQPDQVASLAWESELDRTEPDFPEIPLNLESEPSSETLEEVEDPDEIAALHQQWEALLNDSESGSDSEQMLTADLEAAESDSDQPLEAALEEAFEPEPTAIQPPKLGTFFERYCPDASEADQDIFRQRAASLREAPTDTDPADLRSLAVVGLGNQYFGLDLSWVREFINIRSVTPIPCCPQHIVGNINLRGEVMTLVNIQKALNLSDDSRESPQKAVVFEVDDVVAGLTVDEVIDVTALSSAQIAPIPAAVSATYREFLQGMILYDNQYLNLLDLPKMISQGVLSVA
ncbi:chemotaxis protein CheW [Acaryochloris marina]|uniref:Chemotaxis signal transduction protein CheW, putative n=1 Tax=Acaryochloris marina (strain MBIC 11017) TaxID=329726 RepID=B0C767_ACAM1|nr:chemotaxis protein CheW [Acaryochloris marina]ABW30044.1 chemotaxis signal transduction protein CheW, putative [Acaryochloris marina MBIC11017]